MRALVPPVDAHQLISGETFDADSETILSNRILMAPMSSPSQGPYKSRLFNLINRQSIHFSDRLEKTVRQLKVAAEWGVQILLYPIYLAVQTLRLVDRQLEYRFEQVKLLTSSKFNPERQPETPDQPIEQVLAVVEPWVPTPPSTLLPEAPIQTAEETSLELQQSDLSSMIQGIATLLETRRLVLIAQENQILPILSQEQEKQLRRRISWEIGNYQRKRRLAQLAGARQLIGRLPAIKNDNPNLLPPVRFFWQVMRWMQTSQIAITVNLFGESNLACPVPTYSSLTLSETHPQLLPTRVLSTLDSTVAGLEIQLHPSKETARPDFVQIQALINTAIDYFFGRHRRRPPLTSNTSSTEISPESVNLSPASPAAESSPSKLISSAQKSSQLASSNLFSDAVSLVVPTATQLIQILAHRLQALRQKLQDSQSKDASEADPFQIQVLIQAAIDYFFSQYQPQLEARSKDTAKLIPPAQPPTLLRVNKPSLEDPWLSWEDLFEESESQPVVRTEPRSPYANLHAKPALLSMAPKKRKGTPGKQKIEHPTKPKSAPSPSAIQSQPNKSRTFEAEEDWVEIEATPVGYVKHPLEKLLEWLDQIVLWIEELVAAIWGWLRSRFQ